MYSKHQGSPALSHKIKLMKRDDQGQPWGAFPLSCLQEENWQNHLELWRTDPLIGRACRNEITHRQWSMAELLETLQTKVELVKRNCGDMCFHSGAHVTAISIFYEVPPGELFKIKAKKKKKHRHCQNWGKSQPFIQSPCFMLETKTRWYFPCRLNLVIEHLCG